MIRRMNAECNEVVLGDMNPSEIFIYEKEMWISVNKTAQGYLSKKLSLSSESGGVILPYDAKIEKVLRVNLAE